MWRSMIWQRGYLSIFTAVCNQKQNAGALQVLCNMSWSREKPLTEKEIW